MDSRTDAGQLFSLFMLALPIASIVWTLTHEEIAREPREWCKKNSETCQRLYERKFFYIFTCEYCLSHYVTAIFLFLARFKLVLPDWRGYVIGGFALVWIANFYMAIFARVRLGVKFERAAIVTEEKKARTGSM